MHAHRLIDLHRLTAFLESIEPGLLRYPAIDPETFRAKVHTAVAALRAVDR